MGLHSLTAMLKWTAKQMRMETETATGNNHHSQECPIHKLPSNQQRQTHLGLSSCIR